MEMPTLLNTMTAFLTQYSGLLYASVIVSLLMMVVTWVRRD
jgi:hypothetical protein